MRSLRRQVGGNLYRRRLISALLLLFHFDSINGRFFLQIDREIESSCPIIRIQPLLIISFPVDFLSFMTVLVAPKASILVESRKGGRDC